jgi:predicted dehydrogenase
MKVLIIGLGSIAKKHINALIKINAEVEIWALRSSIESTNIDGVNNLYDYCEITNTKFDFVIISNPTSLHAETIKELIKYDLPMFIEKPVFNKIIGEKIIQEIKNKGLITYSACNLRFLESLKFSRDFIRNKVINEVNSYCGSYLPDWRPDTDFRKIYSANKEMGGGVHIDLIHEMDYIYWFFGMPNKLSSIMTSNSSLHISAYDYTNYNLKYDRFSVNIILNYYRRDSKRTLEILTNEGTLFVDLLANNVSYKNKIIFESNKTILDTYEDQLRFFIKNILEKKEEFNTINEAYQILKLCLQED